MITLDTDFIDIVRYPPADSGGIIALLLRSRPERLPFTLARLTDWLDARTEAEPLRGRLCLAEPHRLRFRA